MKKSNSMNSGVSKALRHIVFERDSYTCVLCERGATDCHHMLPRSQGGRNTPYNLVSLCRQHHMAIHGEMNLNAEDIADMKQTILEYMADAHTSAFYKEFLR